MMRGFLFFLLICFFIEPLPIALAGNKSVSGFQSDAGRIEREDKRKAMREEQEREYWCKKASQCNRRIEKERDQVEEAEGRLSELRTALSIGSAKEKKDAKRNMRNAEKNLERLKKQLAYAEKDMSEIEEEARRKDIPPGWLRCQFE